jgi:hypothetical protein
LISVHCAVLARDANAEHPNRPPIVVHGGASEAGILKRAHPLLENLALLPDIAAEEPARERIVRCEEAAERAEAVAHPRLRLYGEHLHARNGNEC